MDLLFPSAISWLKLKINSPCGLLDEQWKEAETQIGGGITHGELCRTQAPLMFYGAVKGWQGHGGGQVWGRLEYIKLNRFNYLHVLCMKIHHNALKWKIVTVNFYFYVPGLALSTLHVLTYKSSQQPTEVGTPVYSHSIYEETKAWSVKCGFLSLPDQRQIS